MPQNIVPVKSLTIDDEKLEDPKQWGKHVPGEGATFSNELITRKEKPRRRKKPLEQGQRRILVQSKSSNKISSSDVSKENCIDSMGNESTKDDENKECLSGCLHILGS